MSVRIVTDSTADLPEGMAEELEITVVPLKVFFGEEAYRDGVDITPDQFFARLAKSHVLPTTSQPSVGDFLEVYQSLSQEADGIVSIHIAASLSGTVEAASLARQSLAEGCPIEIMDSSSTSLGLGLVVMKAAAAARAGASLEEVAAVARRAAEQLHIYFMVDTLEYLQRGGRIGRAQAFLGTLLQVKPILSIRDGVVHPLERVRTRAKALDRLFELITAFPSVTDFGVVHATTPQDAQALVQRLGNARPDTPVFLSRLGPVVGTHGGPGVVGVGALEGDS